MPFMASDLDWSVLVISVSKEYNPYCYTRQCRAPVLAKPLLFCRGPGSDYMKKTLAALECDPVSIFNKRQLIALLIPLLKQTYSTGFYAPLPWPK